MMNNSFDRVMEIALVEWKFSRTRMWLEWTDKGNTVPVSFNRRKSRGTKLDIAAFSLLLLLL